MKFQKNISGNPGGRPRGIMDKRTELRKLLEPYAEALVEKVIELALAGDINALRLCIERLIPRIKNETIKFSMPELDLTKAQSLLEIGSAILEAVANGDIAPEHACHIAALIEGQRKTIETSELDARIIEIEHVFNLRKKMEKKDATN
jgi:hypothetical protein